MTGRLVIAWPDGSRTRHDLAEFDHDDRYMTTAI
jgi:hypothetical protein